METVKIEDKKDKKPNAILIKELDEKKKKALQTNQIITK